MKKSSAAIGVSALFIAAVFLFISWRNGWLGGGGDRALYRMIKDQPAMVALYDTAVRAQKNIADHPDNASQYFDTGLYWKSIAEQLQGSDQDRTPFFNRSLAVYERGIVKFGQTNILFYLNAGSLAEQVNDFEKSERYYKKAIEISPGDESGYLNLADLYSYRMHKSKEEVLAVFAQGMKVMLDTTPLVAGRASYLRRIGDGDGAIADYETLSKTFPSNQSLKMVIAELKQSLLLPE